MSNPYCCGLFKVVAATIIDPGLVRVRLRSTDFQLGSGPFTLNRPGDCMSRKYKRDERQDIYVYRWFAPPEKEVFHNPKGDAWLVGELVAERYDAKEFDGGIQIVGTVTIMISADVQSESASEIMLDLLSMREGWHSMVGSQLSLFEGV